MSRPTAIIQPRTRNRVQTPVSQKRQLNNSISALETVVASRELWLQIPSYLDELVYQLYGHSFHNVFMMAAFIVLTYAFKDQIASEATKLIKKITVVNLMHMLEMHAKKKSIRCTA